MHDHLQIQQPMHTFFRDPFMYGKSQPVYDQNKVTFKTEVVPISLYLAESSTDVFIYFSQW